MCKMPNTYSSNFVLSLMSWEKSATLSYIQDDSSSFHPPAFTHYKDGIVKEFEIKR